MARQTTGELFKRGKAYCLRYQVNGKRVSVTLRDEQGRTITDPKAAEDARKALLAPLGFKDKARQHREVAKALRTAEDEAREAERNANEGREREEAERNKLPIADAWERFPYIENTRGKTKRRLSPATVRDNASHWGTFAAWAEGEGIRAVEDITPEHAAAFSRHLRDRATANRHNKTIFTCSVVCRLSGRPNPFATVDLYSTKRETVHRQNLEPDEIRRVIATATGELRRLFIIGTYTGLRLKDCATLQWADIRLGGDGGRIIRETSKTGEPVRFPMHPELRAELEETPASERSGDVCPELAATYRRDPVRLSNMTRQVFEACGLATQAGSAEGRAVVASIRGFHSFRHSFATEAARAGVPLGLVKEWLGHSSPEITRIYENWKPDRDSQRVLAALPSLDLPEAEGAGEPEGREEREQLARLTWTLPLEMVRELLEMVWSTGRRELTAKGNGP